MVRNPLLVVGFFLMVFSCAKDHGNSDAVQALTFEQPGHFPQAVYSFENNPLSSEGFELGRKLFYDPLLSVNNSISCGSCHTQAFGFSDKGKAFSTGVNDKVGKRNSPALANLAWYPAFMADGGINHIEVMPIAPITDSLEMAEDLATLIQKLQLHPDYPALFTKVFGSNDITAQKMLYALAQFMAMMVSSNSKFDHFLQGKVTLSPSEKRGYDLFTANCNSCHSGALSTDFSYRNNGLDVYSEDPGRARITQKEEDHGKFKVPSLRNIALSPPYMHDGRFASLNEVIDHYTANIQPATNLDPVFKTPIQLSENDKTDLLNFLETLTDYEYIVQENLTDPATINP